MNVHELKIWPKYYRAVIARLKKFEIRENDRNFKVGDVIHLKEFEPTTKLFTGRECDVMITYMIEEAPGMNPGYCLMTIEVVDDQEFKESITKTDDLDEQF